MKKISKLFVWLLLFIGITNVNAIEYDPTIITEEDGENYSIVQIQEHDDSDFIITYDVSKEYDKSTNTTNNYEYSYSTKDNNMNFKSNGFINYLKFYKSSDTFTLTKPTIDLAGNNTINKLHIADKVKVEGNGTLKINKALETVLRKDKDGKQLYIPTLNMKSCFDGSCETEPVPILNISDDFFDEEKLEDILTSSEDIEDLASVLYVTEDYDIKTLEKPAQNMEKLLSLLLKSFAEIFGVPANSISIEFEELTKENVKLVESYEVKEKSITSDWVNKYIETTMPITYNSDGSILIGEKKDVPITDFDVIDYRLDEEKLELTIGSKVELLTSITPRNATEDLVWKSSNESVVTVTNRGYVNAIKNGTANITIENKAGKKVTVTIVVYKPIGKAQVTPIKDQIYTGKEIKPEVTLTYEGEKLVLGRDYEVKYENNIKVGVAYADITGIGEYSGHNFETFRIVSNTVFTAKQSARTNTTVTLKWNKPTAKTTGYQVYMATSKNGKYSKVATITKSSTTSYKKTKLQPGKKYYFKIRNYYKSGKKTTYGNFVEVSATTCPSTPSIKLASNTSAVLVKWSKTSGATGYEIYQSTDNKTYTKVGTTTDTSYMVKDLKSASTYYYKVRAYRTIDGVNVNGYSSKVVKITTKPLTPVVTNTALSYNAAIISWDKVDRASGYQIYRSTDGKKYTKIKTTTATSFKDIKLNVGTTYYYKVRAYKTVSKVNTYGSYSKVVSVKPYLKASTLTGYDNYYDYARITFTKVSGASGYKVYRANTVDGKYTYIGKTTALYYNDKTAKANTEYFYKVVAYRNINKKAKNGLTSKEVSSKRLGYTLKFKGYANTYNSNRLEIEKDPTATKYYIYRATSKNGKYSKIATLNASDFEDKVIYIDTKLSFNKTYYYKIRIGYKNASNYSKYYYVKTRLATPKVTSEVIDNKVTIKYDKVGYASGYEIYKSTDGINYKKVKTTTATSYIDPIVLDKTSYYKVRAYKTIKNVKYYSLLSSALEVNSEEN